MKNIASLLSVAVLSGAFVHAQAEDWIGNASIHNQPVPIHLSLTSPKADGSVTGSFINGDEKTVSNKGVLKNGHLILSFDYFARKLEGDIKDGNLEATFSGARGTPISFALQREAATAQATTTKGISKIAGDWEVAVKSPNPILVAGTPDQLNEKLPQGKNLNCWPTAFFVGRDGLVKEAHAGFAGPATGQAYIDLKAETETLIEKLLKQSPQTQSANITLHKRSSS
jgi:hypothetical protein